ncbi:phosphodiester glycosidase family protein [Streptomyces sp. LP05-1]|uniref:Phosphodiester glycosidase family protein n=1 Tax=Streptomyces pyxinae TaxID=2970734 RepID=A0ABT2CBU3_9ACTN|nr:phosphodiester glycosidase family protein [Streptomyces sp. LP05-1]MCS0634878.1 phosphodiester glycosidase family protein [Streptomyces sp. LP05-1]
MLLLALVGTGVAGAPPAAPAPAGARVAGGVTYRQFDIDSPRGTARAHLLTVDLDVPGVSVGLLYPGKVAARSALSALADGANAVGGVNGDFFHLSETQHPGVEATGAPVGPAVVNGRALKAAVPKGQRFGPSLPPGTNPRQVLGVGTDGRARVGELTLDGTVTTPDGSLPLGGLNQYALPVGSVGLFTADWGTPSRVRATCGTDTRRDAPCSTETYEVTVRGGEVVAAAATPGRGAIPAGTQVLVGREAGAARLRELSVGDRVSVRYALVGIGAAAFRFAVGGFPVLRGGRPLDGMDTVAAAVRTAAGTRDSGRRLLLLALDGGTGFRTGLTVVEMAGVMRDLGAVDAVNLDGGGSSTLVARAAGADRVSVLNHPSGGAQRPVPNGIGVFAPAG